MGTTSTTSTTGTAMPKMGTATTNTEWPRPPESEDAFWHSLGWEHRRHAQDRDYPPLFLKR
jgi:hypothetical protein